MKRTIILLAATLLVVAAGGWLALRWVADRDAEEEAHFTRSESLLLISGDAIDSCRLYRAGGRLADAVSLSMDLRGPLWLSGGNYFLMFTAGGRTLYSPLALTGYRSGPDEGGSFVVSLRPPPSAFPPRLRPDEPEHRFIPSGTSRIGDRQNPHEPHYVWLTGYFIAPFEVSNREFRMFIADSLGYDDERNWSEEGKRWKRGATPHSTALLEHNNPEYARFGSDDLPVTQVTWFEANAFCRWMTRKLGGGRWLYSLPADPEWEKAARGPDNFDYALGMTISDGEAGLYNWRKNPDAPVAVLGREETRRSFHANRYGLYHMTGNVTEWTQSVNIPYGRDHPYAEDERNHDETPGLRSVRGGSWYSASIAYLYIPYRDAFQPEHSNQELGFRIVVRALP